MTGMLAIFLREPSFFSDPRFWGEEGLHYYAHAFQYSHGPLWYMGLANTPQGYFAFWPSLSAVISANLVPVDQAPLVTTVMAFLVQLIPLGLIIWSDSLLWNSSLRKAIGVLVVLLTPLSGEIWLNTINSQFYLALATVLILMEPIKKRPLSTWLYRFVLLLAGLTGPVSVMLVPAYAIVTWLTREQERGVQTGILGVCALLQTGLVLHLSTSDYMELRFAGLRHSGLFPLVFAIWTQGIGLMIFGKELMHQLALWVIAGYRSGSAAILIAWIGLAIITFSLFWWLSVPLVPYERVTLLGSYVLLVTFSYIGALSRDKLNIVIGVGERYFWVPNVIFSFLLTRNIILWPIDKLRAIVCSAILFFILIFGAIQYRSTLLFDPDWPRWRTEIAIWQYNPEYKVKIWPPGWEIELKKPAIKP